MLALFICYSSEDVIIKLMDVIIMRSYQCEDKVQWQPAGENLTDDVIRLIGDTRNWLSMWHVARSVGHAVGKWQ